MKHAGIIKWLSDLRGTWRARLQLEKQPNAGKCQSRATSPKKCIRSVRCEGNLLWWPVNGTNLKESSSQSAWSARSALTHDSLDYTRRFIRGSFDALLTFLAREKKHRCYTRTMRCIYTSITPKGNTERSVAPQILSFFLSFFAASVSLSFCAAPVGLFLIGCAGRSIVPPIVTIPIIHSVRETRTTTRVTTLSGREREAVRQGERERERKSEVLIRTLINLFCSDPSVGSSSDVRAWGRGEGEEKTRKIGNRAPIASRRE